MPLRCGSCNNCNVISAATIKIKDKKRKEKKRKLVSIGRACTGSTVSTTPGATAAPPKKVKRITELETLNAHISGGSYVASREQDLTFVAKNEPVNKVRTIAAEGAMALPTFNQADVDAYKATVALCRKEGAAAEGDIASEYHGVMKKLESVLHLDRDEIDWDEQLGLAGYVQLLWGLALPVGKLVFELSRASQQHIIDQLIVLNKDIHELQVVKSAWFEYFGSPDVLDQVYSMIPPDLKTNLTVDFLKYVFHKATTTNQDL
jgi:hypothetical protein